MEMSGRNSSAHVQNRSGCRRLSLIFAAMYGYRNRRVKTDRRDARRGQPSVPLARHAAEEVRLALVDAVQAQFDSLAALGLLLGHPPAQVHLPDEEAQRLGA